MKDQWLGSAAKLLVAFFVAHVSIQGGALDMWRATRLNEELGDATLLFAHEQFWFKCRYGSPNFQSSPDGKLWRTPRSPFTSGVLEFDGGKFLSVDAQGIYTSTDGENWRFSPREFPHVPFAGSLKYGNGGFVTVSRTGGSSTQFESLSWSERGTNWAVVHHLASKNEFVAALNFVNGIYIASIYAPRPYLAISTNGQEWVSVRTEDAKPLPPMSRIAFGKGKYVALSADLVTFTSTNDFQIISNTPLKGRAGEIIFAAGKFVAVGSGVFHSDDGVNWNEAVVPQVGFIPVVAYGNDRFVAVGRNTKLTSTNGVDWEVEGQAIAEIMSVTHGNGLFVGTGKKASSIGSAIMLSSSPSNWRVLDVLPGTETITTLTFADGEFMGLATGGKAYSSTNGLAWKEVETGLTGATIKAMIHVSGRYWGAGVDNEGNGIVVRSNPGSPWEVMNTFIGVPLNSIAFGRGSFVAGGGKSVTEGHVFVSPDGEIWQGGPKLNFLPYAMTFAADRFVTAGQYGGPASSTNGIDWIQQPLGNEWFRYVGYYASQFVVAASINVGDLFISPDGEQWAIRQPIEAGSIGARPETLRLVQIVTGAAGSRRFVLASANALFESELIAPKFRGLSAESGFLRLNLENPMQEAYDLEISTDLRTWTPHSRGSALELTDQRDAARRFYRIKVEQD